MTKTEKAVIALTLLFLTFALGYHLGRRTRRDDFLIVTERESAVTATGELPAAPRTAVERAAPERELVNINTAGAAELCTLDGIGETLAERIIAYREANGPFAKISDITLVPGIGSGTYSKICASITVN